MGSSYGGAVIEPAYPEAGASVSSPLPVGWDHLHERERLVGEEAFVLDRTAAGTWSTISASSRTAAWYPRLGAPVTRLVQRRILSIYMASLHT